ncbi:hypothetical protein V6N13_117874 [Hibiscus sabdariffa]|uniref:Uncharacterized protein n=1 Tax=Hibiscus sabdariffa TaxID=183260 RepID=A0ABR2Q9S8_9ROSI
MAQPAVAKRAEWWDRTSCAHGEILASPYTLHVALVMWSSVMHIDQLLGENCEDEENIVPMMKDDDVHLLDGDDVETGMTDMTKENGLGVEDDVWSTAVARLVLENEKHVWGYVGSETDQLVPIYPTYKPPTRMYDVNYTAIGD